MVVVWGGGGVGGLRKINPNWQWQLPHQLACQIFVCSDQSDLETIERGGRVVDWSGGLPIGAFN